MSEALWILGFLAAAWLVSLALLPAASLIFAALLLFTLYFFRDPERTPSDDPRLAVSPADGLVDTIDEVEESEFLRQRVRRIGIFLSVFDVHVNRSPIEGTVTHSEPKPGKFLDARNPRSFVSRRPTSRVLTGRN